MSFWRALMRDWSQSCGKKKPSRVKIEDHEDGLTQRPPVGREEADHQQEAAEEAGHEKARGQKGGSINPARIAGDLQLSGGILKDLLRCERVDNSPMRCRKGSITRSVKGCCISICFERGDRRRRAGWPPPGAP